MSRILTEFENSKTALRRYLGRRKNSDTHSVEDFDDPDVVGSGNQPGVEQEAFTLWDMSLIFRTEKG